MTIQDLLDELLSVPEFDREKKVWVSGSDYGEYRVIGANYDDRLKLFWIDVEET